MDVSHAVPPCLPCLSIKYILGNPSSYIHRCKASLLMITESPYPIKGHSEVVFHIFRIKPLAARSFASAVLSVILSISTLLFNVLFYSACIVAFFSLSVKKFFYLFSSAAFFILLAASAWTRIVWINLLFLHDGS